MKNDKDLKPIKLNVPGDPSSAAFFITAACLKPGSKLVVKNMLFNKTRIGFIKTLKSPIWTSNVDISTKLFHNIGPQCLQSI